MEKLPATTNPQELQRIESKPLKGGRLLFLARRSQPIIDAAPEDIAAILKYVMLKLGLRAKNLPDELEKQVLISHIKTYYPANTIDEIRLAFDLAINEDLDINPDDLKPYENFSCQYFSRIMNAYLSWAVNQLRMITPEPPQQHIYTDEENENLHRQLTENFYQRLRSGRQEEIPQYCHSILVKDKYIRPDQAPAAFFTWCLGKGIKKLYEKI